MISTVAGNGTIGFGGDGNLATGAQLAYPYGIAVDSVGSLYIADSANQRIREVTTAGIIISVAGNGTRGFNGDGVAATSTSLSSPQGVTVDIAGNIYIADTGNDRIRMVTTAGVISKYCCWHKRGRLQRRWGAGDIGAGECSVWCGNRCRRKSSISRIFIIAGFAKSRLPG